MPDARHCPKCGVPLPGEGWEGLCPKCLVRISLEQPPGPEEREPRPAAVGAAAAVPDTDVSPDSGPGIEQPGTVIGRYKLLQQIGEGGFGMVFMAEQMEPVQRKVALKVIKAGMDTREVISRFEAERQALALMDHPNIARVLDGGATANGRPYFVMELVRGAPITEYCDQCTLSTRERLDLFIQVCRAVQHAHQKGVIHRDLKPTNVLVTLHDGEPVPKVIDFGVAKALGQKLTQKTLFTRFEQMIGTPAYMSPEQAALSGLDIDTRSDIYSLGVLLYELLTGVTPFDRETLAKAALDEIRRMIRETEPPKPSTRLASLGQPLAEVAKRRHAEPAALCRSVRGDLDWITMKAMEKDRQRRYETVNGLAADIQQYLNNEPVMARPPSGFYRLQKLVRRNQLAFAAGASIVAALAIGLAVSTFFYFKERSERYRAVENEKDALAAALESFRLTSALGRLSGHSPDWSNTVPALRKAASGWSRERIRRELRDRPELQAELLHYLGHIAEFDGSVANSLSVSEAGDFAESALLLRRSLLLESLSLYQQVYGLEHPSVAEVLNDLAADLSFTPQEAEEHARAALAMRKKLLDPQGLEVADSLVELGDALGRQTNKTLMAEAAYLEALAIRTNHLRPEAITVAVVYGLLSGLQESRGDLAAAEQSLRHATLSRGETFATLYGVSIRLRLASILRKRGSLPGAEEECIRALEIAQECSRAYPNAAAGPLEYLVIVLSEEDKLPEAEARAQEFLTLFEPGHPQNWRTFNGKSKLGTVLLREKKYPDAERWLTAGYEGFKREELRIPDPNRRLKEAIKPLVQLYTEWGKPAQADQWTQKLSELERPNKP